ncbi:hypothetical protein Moror_9668 [Moniliophthora roreri MCA 2997]|uniref:F-box domain-containing protein n=1 Tax=Moniliophthora roreri (strain MCA 2997) TaxID=1381753 RepID=V2WLJ2_MONRO|nr:hypothetical protein Moror_9668 [Moniliophthora roreri MCA 2997]
MPPFIAPELIAHILQHIPYHPYRHDLDHCALISRSWTPYARSITFQDICISQPKHMFRFADLLASPHETISVAVKCMTIQGGWFEFFATTRDLDTGLVILEVFVTRSSLKFSVLEQLNLKNIAWENIPLSIQNAFIDTANPFPSLVWIQQLELVSCSFESYSQYWELIHAFPLLESLHHNEHVDISFESVPNVVVSGTTSRRPLQLHALRWHATDIPSKGTWQNAAMAFNTLLLECRESLEELELIVTQRYYHFGPLRLSATQTLKDLFSMFDLTYTTRLQKLLIHNMASIKQESYNFLPAFLENMTQTRSKTLQDLELRSCIPMKHHGYKEDIHESSSKEEEDEDGGSSKENEDLYGIPVNLVAMDTILRDPFFNSLQ